jgi:hypothetical protein
VWHNETRSLSWEIDGYVHTFSGEEIWYTTLGERRVDGGAVVIAWSPASGVITISELNGEALDVDLIFTEGSDGSFLFRMEHFDSWYATTWADGERVPVLRESHFLMELTGSPGVTLPQRNFFNIADIDEDFVERAIEFFENLFIPLW